MIRKFIKFSLAAFAATALAASAAWAGGDLAKAKKEGKVVWYSSISLPIAQEMCNTFNKKKMGFECVLHRRLQNYQYHCRYSRHSIAVVFVRVHRCLC